MQLRLALALVFVQPELALAQTVTVPLPSAPAPAAGGPVTVPLPGAPGPTPVQPQPQSPPRVPINPYGRAIDMSVGVQFSGRDLGELSVHMDLAGQVTFNGAEFAAIVGPLLNAEGQVALSSFAQQRKEMRPEDFKSAGIDAYFDRENVVITVRSIFPKYRTPQPLYERPDDTIEKAVTASPEDFSFFANVGLSETRYWNGPRPGWRDPSVFLSSAVRGGPIVVEFQGQFADRLPGTSNPDYRFDRNYVRAVYDLPQDFTRLVAGDLTPEVRMQQNFVQMAGLGYSRQKRRFDDFNSAVLQGNRQLILQNESTVDIYRNGTLFQQIQLAPGTYDLSNLPLFSGSNDIRIDVRGNDGASQSLTYQTYIDPIDLAPGDWEAGLYIGKLATNFGLSPKYNGDWAATGFYRKALIGRPAIGFGFQASRQVQQVSAQTQFLVGSGGRLDLTAAASKSPTGTGWLLGLSYDLSLQKGSRSDQVVFQLTTQSKYFTGLGAPFLINTNVLTASAAYSHAFGPDASIQIGTSYSHNLSPTGDEYRIFIDADYRISRSWAIRGGIDYQHSGLASIIPRRNGLGFSVALIFQPSTDDRAEARYNYRVDNAQLSYQHSPDGYVGSIGYGAIAQRNADNTNLTGYGTYRSNRFDLSASQSMTGTTIGGITDRQVTNVRMSTALVFAGGEIAISRRVGDSFAIVEGHESLKGRKVVIGQLLGDSRYRSASGTLGGAVNGGLGSYHTQSVYYDVEEPPLGYDIGPGVYRVRPPYHSGYHLMVGSNAYVSAVGTLVAPGGVPVATLGGSILDLGKPDQIAIPFFTNSVGRFAISNLEPGHEYRVQLYSGGAFKFRVPDKSDALLNLQTITIGADE